MTDKKFRGHLGATGSTEDDPPRPGYVGPTGRYELVIPETETSLEDRSIAVVANDGVSRWTIEVDKTDPDGARILLGMTRDGSGLWFELSIGDVVQMHYWADRQLMRVDKLA